MPDFSDTLPVARPLSGASYSAVELADDNGRLWLLDQRRLPQQQLYVACDNVVQVARAISDMVVRGAPAIGIAATYGMVLASREADGDTSGYLAAMRKAAQCLCASRPTAVNLSWAVGKCLGLADRLEASGADASERVAQMAQFAREIHRQDVQACRAIGQLGARRIADGATVLTHCNAGALATGGYGTALGVIRAAWEAGKRLRVLADETRPYLQGARLTAWELQQDGIDVRVICDNTAGHLFGRGEIDLVVVGADRIARSGDVANKIGTYSLACLASMHERPFYVAAPCSTIDMECAEGAHIPIEYRPSDEILVWNATRVAPENVEAIYPAFDVTPHRLVTAIFTERGVIEPVTAQGVCAL